MEIIMLSLTLHTHIHTHTHTHTHSGTYTTPRHSLSPSLSLFLFPPLSLPDAVKINQEFLFISQPKEDMLGWGENYIRVSFLLLSIPCPFTSLHHYPYLNPSVTSYHFHHLTWPLSSPHLNLTLPFFPRTFLPTPLLTRFTPTLRLLSLSEQR